MLKIYKNKRLKIRQKLKNSKIKELALIQKDIQQFYGNRDLTEEFLKFRANDCDE